MGVSKKPRSKGVPKRGLTARAPDPETQAFVDWLKPYDAVWRTKPGTSVMMQQFEVVHIGE